MAAFRPDRELLFGYYDAAHRATVERVGALTEEQMQSLTAYMPGGDTRPTWRAFVGTASDFMEHTEQIAYLRGLVQGPGVACAGRSGGVPLNPALGFRYTEQDSAVERQL